jgi:superfamily II DNA/RNA helicase
MTLESYRLTFVADEAFLKELRSYAAKHSEQITIEDERRDDDATRLGFDLSTISAVTTIVASVLYVGELATKVATWQSRSDANKVIVQTPFRTIELHKTSELSVEDIRQLLLAAQQAE